MFSKEVQDAYAALSSKSLTLDEFLAIMVRLSPAELRELSRLMLAEVGARRVSQ